MSQRGAAVAVGRLIAAFGRDSVPAETAGLYLEKLADVEGELLRATVERAIDTLKFFPKIAELRLIAADLAGLLPPSPPEALAMIRRADVGEWRGGRDGTRGYFEKSWDWSHVPEEWRGLVEGVLAKVGEPSDLEGKPHFSWEMGFQRTYETEAEVVRRDALANLSQARLQDGRKAVGAGDGITGRALGAGGSN